MVTCGLLSGLNNIEFEYEDSMEESGYQENKKIFTTRLRQRRDYLDFKEVHHILSCTQ